MPVLWDKTRGTIVNNESAEIIRMLNTAFAAFDRRSHRLLSARLREEIDAHQSSCVYDNINNGVYRSGFAHDAGRL